MKNTISDESRTEAAKIARATQKPGQTKEQTKLIAQGIEKGIAEYKKQQKSKARERDKNRKQQQKAKIREPQPQLITSPETMETSNYSGKLPWILLALSWVGFIASYLLLH